ncbi:glycosyltransferase family 4 protein [Cellulomonas sp. JH27-2]|uniref:glycosyltransferase family 4 protein n=1 Tax=Cellulomonas sp. JH27-2 TaxID=2774139 RepID=UPI00177C8A8D|nr:glycosyltransferase family 4 protein [Cellulomonas sp. JH27-2]MBD8059617.1 glycosyltransferase family 4 protein [Cellulomonas sp. JH27-2]
MTQTAHDPAEPTAGTRARLYRSARTAHLERAAELPPALLLFEKRRYDFDQALADRVGAVEAGTFESARILGRSGVTTLEVNEPSAVEGARRTAAALAWLRLRALVRLSQRPRVVAYAIGNSSPFVPPEGGTLRSRWSLRLDYALARYVWFECDRIAFGTPDARDAYREAFGRHPRPLRTTVIPALPIACPCVDDGEGRPPRVVFLGAFTARKGFRSLVESWGHVLAARPDAELVLVGKGDLEPLAHELANDPTVRLVVDPPREAIHDELRHAAVLTLPSRRAGRWREQVGLPIVEGLAHGCTVVTTEETGLAAWLSEHGHHVTPESVAPADLAASIVGALDAHRPPSDVRSQLPAVDGRLAADAWMFSAAPRDQ